MLAPTRLFRATFILSSWEVVGAFQDHYAHNDPVGLRLSMLLCLLESHMKRLEVIFDLNDCFYLFIASFFFI